MSTYVDAAGLRTYYEDTGSGPPLVLLHGGLSTAESWAGQVPALAERHRVLVPERRGHGRTSDVDGPFTYAAMGEDTAAFLETVLDGPAHLVGWSDGAVVAALVAMERPDLVERLVLIGQYYDPSGRVPGADEMLAGSRDYLEQMIRPVYDAVSPDGPEHLPVVLDKVLALWAVEPDIPLADLATIAAPTLVMQGDDDLVTVEHSAALVRALPAAQLAVVPGTSHALPMEKPDLVNRLILDFVAGRAATKLVALPTHG